MSMQTAIYLAPPNPVYHLPTVPQFESLYSAFSSQLYSALYLNLLETIGKAAAKFTVVPLVDEKDRNHLPDEFYELLNGMEPEYIDTGDLQEELDTILSKANGEFANTILLRTNSMGMTAGDFVQAENLLSYDDETFLMRTATNNMVNLIGFNRYTPLMLENFFTGSHSFDEYFRTVSSLQAFFYSTRSFYGLKTLEDFRVLYEVLGTKESIAFCSQRMHEKFTDIFIEYKELL